MSEEKQSPGEAQVSRRGFMKNAAGIAAGAALGAAAVSNVAKAQTGAYKSILPSTILGANEKVLTGHIGIGGMGRSNLGFCLMRDDIQPIALCDTWHRNLDRASAMLSQKFEDFSRHHDFREIIENDEVDAVVISTPDHWHCLPVLYAVDAGKDIYCEKPISTMIAESRAMREAVNNSDVVFQGGTMQRSGEHFQEAVQLIQEGYIGDIARVETWTHDNTPLEGIGMGDDDISNYEGIDWEFHQGWTEHKPFNTNRWIYNFRWFLDYSGGKITDWGAHLVDIAIWGMGQDKDPKSVVAQGGKYLMQDNRTTPDTLDVLWEFDDYILSFQNRVYNPHLPEGHNEHGIMFYGTLGTLRVDRGGYEVTSFPHNGGCEPIQRGASQMNEPHWQNFVDCIRSREKTIVDVDVLHKSSVLCHMGTSAYVAGTKLNWDPATERFTGNDTEAVKVANDFAYREYQNGWSLEKPYWRG